MLVVKNPPANAGDIRDVGLIPGWGRFPWMKKWQPTPVFWPEKFHGQRSLAGYSPWGLRELDMTEGLTTHTREQAWGGVGFRGQQERGHFTMGRSKGAWARGTLWELVKPQATKKGPSRPMVALVESAPEQRQARRQWVEHTPQPLSLSMPVLLIG